MVSFFLPAHTVDCRPAARPGHPRPAAAEKGNDNMGLWELFILAVGLSMDAFAVAICKGLAIRRLQLRQALVVGLWFGAFQALMPAVGYLLGSAFAELVTSVDHWIAFVLLAIIGANMIREGVRGDEESCDPSLSFNVMLMLAIATSIDALSVGFTIAEYDLSMALVSSLIIAVVTFCICMGGLILGKKAGTRLSGKASILGGVILIAIGLEIFISGLIG